MSIQLSSLPQEIYPLILSYMIDSTRGEILRVCKLFREKVIAYEKPLWTEFLAKRRMTIQGDDLRTQAINFLRGYALYIFTHFPKARDVTKDTKNIFGVKAGIDFFLLNLNHHLYLDKLLGSKQITDEMTFTEVKQNFCTSL
jgi:hypothetical protein